MKSSLKTVTLRNKFGMVAEFLNLGARVKSIKLPINGQLEEMTVNYPDSNDYRKDEFYLGATCGPVANRISNAQFSIDDVQYSVPPNNGKNCLHGGEKSFSHQIWKLEKLTAESNRIRFILELNHLEDGFPGNRVITVEYHLTEDNRLEINYSAKTDQATPMNMTNHTYFSLGQTTCLNHTLKVSSSSFIERFDDGIPTGNVSNASVLCKNIRQENCIEDIVQQSTNTQVVADQGLDHCFLLDNGPFDSPKIELNSKSNGVKLCVYTDQVATQIYTGNFLGGQFYPQQGICLECHGYVDAINQSAFANIIVEPTQTYHHRTVYKFSVEASGTL